MTLDMDTREALWNSQVADVFSTTVVMDSNNDDFSSCTNELMAAHRLVTRLWWNIKSLEEYVKLGIVPRGLRIQIFPAWEADTDFKKLWETGLTQCSRIIINMLIEHDRDLLAKTKIQIQTLEGKLSKFDMANQVTPFHKRLKENLERYEKDIIAGKKRKFIRDKTDYEKSNAFRWKHAGNRRDRGGPRQNMPKSAHAHEELSSSDFLGSSDTDASREGDDANTRKGGYTGKGQPHQMKTRQRYR